MPSINIKTADNAYSRVRKPYVLQPEGWVGAKKVFVREPDGWKEVWPGTFIYTHTGTGYNVNVAAVFGNSPYPGTYIFINEGTILSNTAGVAALTVGTFSADADLQIINNGIIGGYGGGPSANGGPGLDANSRLSLTNNGMIAGGGGGGGNGGSAQMKSGGNNAVWAYGGGGGRGRGPNPQTAGAYGQRIADLSYYPNPPQDPPVYLTDGSDGASGAGGEGGDWGQPGRVGYPYWAWTLYAAIAPTAGGLGGAAIRYSGNVTFVTTGDLRGQLQ